MTVQTSYKLSKIDQFSLVLMLSTPIGNFIAQEFLPIVLNLLLWTMLLMWLDIFLIRMELLIIWSKTLGELDGDKTGSLDLVQR